MILISFIKKKIKMYFIRLIIDKPTMTRVCNIKVAVESVYLFLFGNQFGEFYKFISNTSKRYFKRANYFVKKFI